MKRGAARREAGWLTPLEVGPRVGGISPDRVRRLCERGAFPDAIRTEGGQWRIPASDVDAYLESRRARVRRRASR